MIVLRSLAFNIVYVCWTALLSVALAWGALLPRARMIALAVWYLNTVAWLERHVLGLRYEVRGREHLPPQGSYLVAAKHQSAWETMKLFVLVPDPAVVLKRELTRVPFWGAFARKAEMIPVDRGGRGRALASLIAGARRIVAQGRPIVIFPQGTRTAPGAWHAYRSGVGLVYEKFDLPIVPMALNSGLYWPRHAFLKRPGTIQVEFLPPIAPGLSRVEAMRLLEERLEAATDRLVTGAGGPATRRPEVPSESGP